MRRQRNMFQMKEKDKTPEEQLSDEQIGNLSEKEFRVMIIKMIQELGKRMDAQGFPGGAVVKSLPANAGDTGSSPGLGRSHMPQSNWAREPQLLSLHAWSLFSATREAAIVRGPRTAMKSGPRSPQLERALAQK